MRCALASLGVVLGLTAACGPGPGANRASYPSQTLAAREGMPAVGPAKQRAAGGGARPASSGPVTLVQLLRFAEANAPVLDVARQRSMVGDAEVEGAETLSPHNPELAISAGGRTSGGISRFEFEAELEQRLEIAGERGTRIEAAGRARDASHARVDVARWELHATVHALFYKMLVREKQLAAAAKLESFTKSMRVIIDKRVQAGEDSPLEIIVVKAELAKASQTVLAARQAHRAISLRLAEVVGWPVATPLHLSGELAAPAPIADTESLVAAALRRHPSRRWLALEVRAAEARVEREDREAWPDPSLGVRYAREGEPGGASHVWMGTVRIPLPLWERNQAGRARARAELGVARAKRGSFERALEARIAASVVRVDAAAERVALYERDILPAFEGNLYKLNRAFVLGEIDVLKLSLIQQRILVAETDALAASEDYYDAVAALEALSGVEVLAEGASKP